MKEPSQKWVQRLKRKIFSWVVGTVILYLIFFILYNGMLEFSETYTLESKGGL